MDQVVTRGEFVSLRAAAQIAGVSVAAVRRRVTIGELPAWRNPRDARAVLVRRQDAEALRDKSLQPLVGNPALLAT